MDWRSSSDPTTARRRCLRQISSWLALCLLLAASGCGRHAVKPNEKEFLADRVMRFDDDGQEAAADEHVTSNREGAAGGRGTKGGGCGCN